MGDEIRTILKEMEGAPSEFQVLPAGRIDMKGYGTATLDEAGAAAIITEFARRGLDMVIDYEHQTLKDVQAPAAGWIKELVWKGKEGLWAGADWTLQAAGYLTNREYRYFSPVVLIEEKTGRIVAMLNVALTNMPRIDNLKPLVAKWNLTGDGSDPVSLKKEKESVMIEQLRKLLGLADDAGEDKILEAATLAVNKAKEAEGKGEVVACREVLDALGAKEDAGREEVVRIVASLKAPGDAAVQLSHEVATLRKELAEVKQTDLVRLALKEGKTSPDELDKWGRDLALKNPEQFKLIVLSRPAGSVIPVEAILPAKETPTGVLDDTQKQVNRMMGVSDETFQKYNK
jgi:phage I-like protein